MRALQISEPNQWRRVEIDTPPDPGAGQAVVRVHRMGVCGTDIACFTGRFPYFEFPRIPGHELGVEVVAVGEGVGNIAVGDKCCVEPYINCGDCYSCRRNNTNCCEHNQTFGVMCDGGLTDMVTLPAKKLHPAPELSYEQAALVETLAIGCHAVDRGGAKSGDNALVLGAGPIGLSALEFVRVSGARPIVADISETRLAFVRDVMGVPDTILIQGNDSDIDTLAKLTDGQLADVVVDATGSHHSMNRAFEFAAFSGRVVYVGIAHQDLQFSHSQFFHRRELTLLASRNALPGDFTRIVKLIGDGTIDTDPWITHRGGFDEVPDLFPTWIDPSSGTLKAIIEIN